MIKELEQYKEIKNIKDIQGVYAVWIGDYCYIGSGRLYDRISGNKSKLKRGVHANKKLQQAYDEIKEVRVEILSFCEDSFEARKTEDEYINHFKMVDGVIVCNRARATMSNNPNTYKRTLTKEVVAKIKGYINAGFKGKEISETFDVSPAMVSKIKNGTRWADVEAIEL